MLKKLIPQIILAIIILFTPEVALAVGISPPVVNVENVSKHTPYKVTIKIFNDQQDKDKDLNLKVTPHGESSKYLTFDDKFTVNAQTNPSEYTFYIDAKTAAQGNYETILTFTNDQKAETTNTKNSTKKKTTSNQVSIIQGASLIIRFKITGDEIVSYELLDSQLLDTETNLPLYINYTLKNTGNVDWKPSKIILTINDTDDDTKFEIFEITNDKIPLLNPGEITENKIELPHRLLTGKYTSTLKFFDKSNNDIGAIQTKTFNIFPPNTLKQKGDLIDLNTIKTNYKPSELIKLNAIFLNNGNIPVTGVLITEIYKDDEIIDIIKGEQLNINSKNQAHFSEIIKLSKIGKYKISSYIEYGNKKTGVKSINLKISGNELSQKETLFIILIFSLLITIIAVIYKKIKKN